MIGEMKAFLKKLKGSGFLKSMAILTSGTLLGTGVIAMGELARTWIFPAEMVGIYTFLLAFPCLFIGIASLRYDVAIVIEKEEYRALTLVKLSLVLMLGVSIVTTAAFGVFLLKFHPEYRNYWYTIPLSFFIVSGYGLNNILNAYNNRKQQYKEISRKYVIRSVVQTVVSLGAGLVIIFLLNRPDLSVLVMFAPYGLSMFVGAWQQSRPLREQGEVIREITWREMWQAAGLYKKLVLYSTPALFINSYSFSCITLMIERLFDPTILGYYSISNRVLGMPITLISGNVAKVYIEEASREYNETGAFIHAFRKSFQFLAALAVPMFLVMYFLAPPLCEVFLGEGWGIAGEYIRLLALMFSFRLIGTALSQSLSVCGKQGVELLINLGLVLASFAGGLLTYTIGGDIYFFLKSICVFRSVCYVALIIMVYVFSKGASRKG